MKNLLPNNFKRKPSDSGYLRYTSLAYQIIATIAVGFAAGYFLDRLTGWTFPVFKVVLSFGAVIISLYNLIKEVSKKNE